MTSQKMLCVGLACLDIVMVCENYPSEDSDQRCISARWQRGGNGSNNCTILKTLGVPCEFLGTISCDEAGNFIRNDFLKHDINIDNCVFCKGTETPTSCVIINAKSGSRTIIHSNKNFPEVTFEDFDKLDLREYSWIHFEGRNSEQVELMISKVEAWNESFGNAIKISVDLEKSRPQLSNLLGRADVVFVERDFVKMWGIDNMENAVKQLSFKVRPGAVLICPWGDQGACAYTSDGKIVSSPAFPPVAVVDTLAAGDTFVASVIAKLSESAELQDALTWSCRVAGLKCGILGFQGLASLVQESSTRAT